MPNIWCICADHLDPKIIYSSRQDLSFSVMFDNCEILLSAIYACTDYLLRRQLCQELNVLQQNHKGPWCFMGDYNVVLGAHEQRGGNLPLQTACTDFKNWTDCNSLIHFMTRGSQFTWSNGRRGRHCLEKRLDRVICNNDWLSFWTSVSCCTLTRSNSDHFPLLLSLEKVEKHHSSSFKFMKMWASHPGCKDVVAEIWNPPIVGCLMFILSQKLKNLKLKLKDWNKQVFGDIHIRVNDSVSAVNEIQKQIDESGHSDMLVDKRKTCSSRITESS